MKNLYALLVSLFMVITLLAQDYGVTNIFFYSSLNPPTKVPNDSIIVNDTVALGVELYNYGSGILGPNDSVNIGLSANGNFIGNFGVRGTGGNLVPSQKAEIIIGGDIVFPTTGQINVCAWNNYTSTGGDPTPSNDTGCKTFTIYALPGVQIQSFTPAQGYRGSEVVIDGINFDPVAANNVVKIGTHTAVVKSATSTKLKVTVPTNAVSEKWSVTTGGKTSTSTQTYTVLIPEVTGFIPDSAYAGDTILITTKDVVVTPAIRFNGVKSQYVILMQDTLKVRVPDLASTGKVLCDVGFDSAYSVNNFVVRTPIDTTSIFEIQSNSDLKVWSTNGVLNVVGHLHGKNLKLYSILGEKVKEWKTLSDSDVELQLNVSDLEVGFYIVRWDQEYRKVYIGE